MSRKQDKKLFNATSQLLGKYYQNLKEAPSAETAKPSPSVRDVRDYGSTDSVIPDDDSTFASVHERGEMPKWLKNFLTWGAILTPFFWFFWSLNASVNEIKSKTDGMNGKLSTLETKMDNASKDLTVGQNDIKVILERIIGKIDRLFDNLTFLQKSKESYPTPKSTEE